MDSTSISRLEMKLKTIKDSMKPTTAHKMKSKQQYESKKRQKRSLIMDDSIKQSQNFKPAEKEARTNINSLEPATVLSTEQSQHSNPNNTQKIKIVQYRNKTRNH